MTEEHNRMDPDVADALQEMANRLDEKLAALDPPSQYAQDMDTRTTELAAQVRDLEVRLERLKTNIWQRANNNAAAIAEILGNPEETNPDEMEPGDGEEPDQPTPPPSIPAEPAAPLPPTDGSTITAADLPSLLGWRNGIFFRNRLDNFEAKLELANPTNPSTVRDWIGMSGKQRSGYTWNGSERTGLATPEQNRRAMIANVRGHYRGQNARSKELQAWQTERLEAGDPVRMTSTIPICIGRVPTRVADASATSLAQLQATVRGDNDDMFRLMAQEMAYGHNRGMDITARVWHETQPPNADWYPDSAVWHPHKGIQAYHRAVDILRAEYAKHTKGAHLTINYCIAGGPPGFPDSGRLTGPHLDVGAGYVDILGMDIYRKAHEPVSMHIQRTREIQEDAQRMGIPWEINETGNGKDAPTGDPADHDAELESVEHNRWIDEWVNQFVIGLPKTGPGSLRKIMWFGSGNGGAHPWTQNYEAAILRNFSGMKR